jgi:hypothetical protein
MTTLSSVRSQVLSGTSPNVVIDGKSMDRALLRTALRAVAGQGDGRISTPDSQRLLGKLLDGNQAGVSGARNYTQAEKNAMKFIRQTSRFTPKADANVRHQVAVNAGYKSWQVR